MIASVYKADGLRLHSAFKDFRGSFKLLVFDHGDDVSVLEDVTVGVFYDAFLGVIFDC